MKRKTIEKFIKSVWGKAVKGYLSIFCLPSNIGKFFDLSGHDALTKASNFILSLSESENIYHGMGLFHAKPQKGRGRESDVVGIAGF